MRVVGGTEDDGPTSRSPGSAVPDVPALPYAASYADAMGKTSFRDFTAALEQIHNDVHVWVGGTMSDISYAAYDPVFFAHHTMIDRAWRIWQHANPGALPPAAILDKPFPRGGPPGLTPRDVLDVTTLGYDYAVSETVVGGTG
jgi:tyrosinase